jgi:hypothetical protein
MNKYGFDRYRPNMSFCTISINHFQNYNFIKRLTQDLTLLGEDPHILRNRLPENVSLWHQKDVNSTYNLPNDVCLVKQLYMGT